MEKTVKTTKDVAVKETATPLVFVAKRNQTIAIKGRTITFFSHKAIDKSDLALFTERQIAFYFEQITEAEIQKRVSVFLKTKPESEVETNEQKRLKQA
jgi:hypothetical protein